MSHGDVTLTGIIEERVRALDDDGDEAFGAVAELHLRVSPTPSTAWQGLWRADGDAPEVIEYRTEVTDGGFIILELTDDCDIEADMLVTYKAMIDDGYDLAMGEGLKLEHDRSVAHNAEVTPEMVAARREKVQARGRTQ